MTLLYQPLRIDSIWQIHVKSFPLYFLIKGSIFKMPIMTFFFLVTFYSYLGQKTYLFVLHKVNSKQKPRGNTEGYMVSETFTGVKGNRRPQWIKKSMFFRHKTPVGNWQGNGPPDGQTKLRLFKFSNLYLLSREQVTMKDQSEGAFGILSCCKNYYINSWVSLIEYTS